MREYGASVLLEDMRGAPSGATGFRDEKFICSERVLQDDPGAVTVFPIRLVPQFFMPAAGIRTGICI
jgi:hypothetical protein